MDNDNFFLLQVYQSLKDTYDNKNNKLTSEVLVVAPLFKISFGSLTTPHFPKRNVA